MMTLIEQAEQQIAEVTERKPSVRWALAGLALSMLLSSLGTSIANVGLPTLARAFNASFQAVQWVVLAYLLAITALIVSAGRLGDIMGRRRLPLKDMSAEYFAQCQLQMLVLDVMRCDLISYSLGGSTIFHLQRDDRWCGLALQLLSNLHTKHISTREPPTSAFYRSSVRQLHDALVQQTVKSMQELSRQRVTEARSAINPRATDRFLDDEPEADPRKQTSRMYPSDKSSNILQRMQHQSSKLKIEEKLTTCRDCYWKIRAT